MAEEKDSCRICGYGFETVLDLGEIYPSTFTEGRALVHTEPLTLVQCEDCGFVQLKHTVNRDNLYREYWYKSSLNQTMLDALQDVVAETLKRSSLKHLYEPHEIPIVIDIGANDGSMLQMFPEHCVTIGFDPALNLREEARERCDFFVSDYFSAEIYNHWSEGRKADIITAIAMFYDLDDPHEFLIDINEVLAPDGIFVIQMTDLVRMLKANAFDNICHEHVGYYSLEVLSMLLESHGLEIFDIQFNDVNGGSVRVFVARTETRTDISESVQQALWNEQEYFSQSSNPFLDFSNRVQEIRMKITEYITHAQYNGITIYGLGASTKGNTLLQYWGIDSETIRAIGEVNPEKYGRRTVGTEIPIIPETELLDIMEEPAVIIVLPWHFADFFKKKLKHHLRNGVYLLFPLPEPMVIADYGEMIL